jgi:hypothetical protein
VDADAQGPAGLDDLTGHVDVGMGGGGIAAGVVVDQDDVAGRQLKGPAHDLARIDRRMVDRAAVLDFVGDQLVFLVEEENAVRTRSNSQTSPLSLDLAHRGHSPH